MDSDPGSPSGRSKIAQIPAAPSSGAEALAAAAAVENLSAAISSPTFCPGPNLASVPRDLGPSAAERAFSPSWDARDAEASPGPVQDPLPPSVPVPLGWPGPFRPQAVTTRSEEESLLTVIRLVDRMAGTGTLSPVERALVAGTKVAFEHLAEECDKLLKRKVSDLAKALSPASPPPHLAPETTSGAGAGSEGTSTKRRAPRKTAKPKKSVKSE